MEIALISGVLTSLPGRYAKALFELACDQGQVGPVGASLESLVKLIQSSKVLSQALVNPTFKRTEQAAVLQEICVSIKAPEMLISFARQLITSQRISYLPQIEKIYHSLASREKGEQEVEVISAYPLTPSQSQFLEGKLRKVVPGTLRMAFTHNPKVLGGIMVRIGSRVIDATLAMQINQLATVMKGNA